MQAIEHYAHTFSDHPLFQPTDACGVSGNAQLNTYTEHEGNGSWSADPDHHTHLTTG